MEGSPVKSRLVPSDCRSVTKTIYPAKSPVIRYSVKYAQPATTSAVQTAESSHLIEAFHAKATYRHRVLVLAGFCALHKKLDLTLRNVNTLGPEGRQLIATPVRAWTQTAVHDGAPKARQSNSVKFQL